MEQHVCPWWFAYTFDNPVRRLVHLPELLLAPWVRPGLTVLDVGCGIGHFSLGLARMVGPCGRVIAADLQERALTIVARRARRAGLADRIATHESVHDIVLGQFLHGERRESFHHHNLQEQSREMFVFMAIERSVAISR